MASRSQQQQQGKKNTTNTTTKNKNTQKSLGSLLRHFEGIEIVIELKTGCMYRGIISSTDEYMNITLDNAINEKLYVKQQQQQQQQIQQQKQQQLIHNTTNNKPTTNNKQQKYDYSSTTTNNNSTNTNNTIFAALHIRGPTIRYIHFPDTIDLSLLIKKGLDRERTAANKYKRGIRK